MYLLTRDFIYRVIMYPSCDKKVFQ